MRAKSEELDLTAPLEQSDQVLHLLLSCLGSSMFAIQEAIFDTITDSKKLVVFKF